VNEKILSKKRFLKFLFFAWLFFAFLIRRNGSWLKIGTTETTQAKSPANSFPISSYRYLPGEIIVKFKKEPLLKSQGLELSEATQFSSVNSILEKSPVRNIQPLFDTKQGELKKIVKIKLESDQKAINRPFGIESNFFIGEPSEEKRLISKLKEDPNVEYAEPNYLYQTSLTPDDPFLDQQWGLTQIQSQEGWDINTGSIDMAIAIIDTGIDYSHEDLGDRIWQNIDEIPGNGIDDDLNGFTDDIAGWDFVNTENALCSTDEDCQIEDNDPSDKLGHGTHVAGIVNATTNNSTGIAGICWTGKIMNIRAGWKGNDGSGYLDTEAISKAIVYAVDNKADLINMSFGSDDFSETIANSLSYANDNHVLMIASAGNSGLEISSFPASSPHVFSIGATDKSDQKTFFSNYGTTIDLAAPGIDILSLRAEGTDMYGDGQHIVEEKYYLASGTSMSAPFVSGVFGLVKALHPSWDKKEFEKMTKLAVDPLSSNFYVGHGRINLYKALSITLPEAEAFLRYPYEKSYFLLSIGEPLEIRGVVVGESFKIEYEEGYYPDQWVEIHRQDAPIDTGPNGASLTTWNTTNLKEKIYTLKLTAYDVQGLSIYSYAFVEFYDPSLGWFKRLSNDYSSAPNVADLHNNGQKEIIVTSAQETFENGLNLYIFGPEGNNFLPANPIILEGGYGASSSPAVGDMDSDGNLEIVVAGENVYDTPFSSEGIIYIIRNNGNPLTGWNPKKVSDEISLESRWCQGWGNDRPCGGFPSSPVLADLNNDGNLEIILLSRYGKLYVFEINGNSLPGFPLLLGEGFWFGNTFNTPAVGDLDNDGRPEIVVALGENNQPEEGTFIYVVESDGTIAPGWPKKIIGDNTSYTYYSSLFSSPVIGDINKDRQMEIFISSWNEEGGRINGWNYNGEPVNNWPVSAPGVIWNVSLGSIQAETDTLILAGAYDMQHQAAYAISSQGNLLPGWPPQNSPRSISAQPLIVDIDQEDDQELIFVSAYDSSAYAYKSSGQNVENWPIQIRQPTYRTPTIEDIDSNGTLEIVTVSIEGNLYLKRLIGTAPKAYSWNTFHHDRQHTGAYTFEGCSPGDSNQDKKIDLLDFMCIFQNYREASESSCPCSDSNLDSVVNSIDLGFVLNKYRLQ